MSDFILVGLAFYLLVCGVALWIYCWYKVDMSEKREKKAIKQALRDAGYV